MKEKKNTNTNWITLTNVQKANIGSSLQQLNEGKGIPIKRAMAQLTKKYGLSQKAK
jgi:methyl coenzyme M reductase subunit C